MQKNIIIVLFMSLMLIGCNSGSKQIAGSAVKAKQRIAAIDQQAAEGREHLAQANVELSEGNDPSNSIDAADGNLEAIQRETSRASSAIVSIQSAIPDIQDKPSAWLSTVKLVAGAVLAVALLLFLWRSGILALAGAAVGLVTPSVKRSAAKLLAENKTKEATAVLREDKQFDRAFVKAARNK